MTDSSSESSSGLAARTRGLRGQSTEGRSKPAALVGLSDRAVALFEADYAASPHRRPKCSREDFAAGYVTCLEAHFARNRKRKPPQLTEDQVDAAQG